MHTQPITGIAYALCLSTTVCTSLAHAQNAKTTLDTVVVTATREGQEQRKVAQSISVIDQEQLERIAPAHPAEAMNRIAGVHINNLGGEGHMSAIRQPITTGGVYLYLEDGVPTRPTGLFNHNALYEINVPQAQRIEVIKGPGSALYGSDSIGGIINTITRPSPSQAEFEINPETGSDGWRRLLATTGAPLGANSGFRLDLNLTENTGFRDAADYSRYATTARLDGFLGDHTAYKTILSYTQVDQSGVSGLEAADYFARSTKNFYHGDVGRREVDALRLSTEFVYEPNATGQLRITPFIRDNQMKLMPSWMLSYDPNDRDYQFQSYGLMTQYRHKLPERNAEWIVGLDIDHSPSTYKEIRLTTTQAGGIYTDTTPTGRVNYDFSADQLSLSPYVHGQWQANDRLSFSTGLRYDYFYVDYQDRLAASVAQQQAGFGGFTHLRPQSQDLSWDHASPKLGLVYTLSAAHSAYANYHHSFRVPSAGELFRAGSSTNTTELQPVKTDSFEIGARGQGFGWINYDLALYHMDINDDIVSYIDTVSNDRKVTNAGKTRHQGIEIAVGGELTAQWSVQAAWSVSRQNYIDYTALYGFPTTQINYAGKTVGKAPKTLGNVTVQFKPVALQGLRIEAEWEHLGHYYTDETNTAQYGGHDLLNLRIHYALSPKFEIYGRVINVTDRLYSTYTSNQVGDPDTEYRPGLPRSYFLGLKAKF